MAELVYIYALNKISNIGQATVKALLHKFGSYPAIFEASVAELIKVKRITPEIAAEIHKFGHHIDELYQEIEFIQNNRIQIIPNNDSRYPNLLKLIPDAPFLLYMLGNFMPEDETALAIVGSRAASEIGQQIAYELAGKLVQQGVTIVSGLALGIDTAGHLGALSAGGRTIACPGSGLFRIYPPENIELAERITRSGAVLSEFPPETTVESKYLLMRDRIIAALSKAVIVIESEEEGGAVYTARKANKYDRKVFYINWKKFQGVSKETHEKFVPTYLKDNGFPLNNIGEEAIAHLVAVAKEKIELRPLICTDSLE
ncbi:MAG: DNA-processing protein DprA [bacterium]|nr:DNA-processing protein DprA [bacterium]